MSDREFDRLIDTAARQMVSHEPSRRLRGAVMARLREPEPVAPRRLAWMTAAMVGVVLGGMTVALMNRNSIVQIPHGSPAAQSVSPQPQATRQAVAEAPDPAVHRETLPVHVARRQRSPVQLPPNDLSGIEPLEAEPIVMTALEVPPLGSERTSIDRIEIAALMIEPLTASND